MNNSELIEILWFPGSIFVLCIIIITFHKRIGRFLYKMNNFLKSSFEDVSHMKTLFKYHRKAFMEHKIEYYYKWLIWGGILIIIGTIFLTLFIWVHRF